MPPYVLCAGFPHNSFLAMLTHMRPPLADHQARDGRPTDRAGFPCPPIDPEVVLEISPTIDPVDTGSVATDALAQGRANGR